MDPARWREVKTVFIEALAASPEERTNVAARLALDDSGLLEEVLSLLRAHEAAEEADWDGPRGPSKKEAVFVPPVVDPRFTVESFLGAGGFGVVYRAWDKELERPVAIKTLRRAGPAGLVRLKNEFRTLADLTHPNLLRLYELFVGEQDVYFSMELVDGSRMVPFPLGTDDSIAQSKRPSNRLLVAAFLQLAEGVQALHRAGILHGDLKPSNVLVTPANRVVILDFGLSSGKLLANADTGQQSGPVGGTPGYMAPELLSGQPLSKASDWYAVGVMLHQALCPEAVVDSGEASTSSGAVRAPYQPPSREVFSKDVLPELASLCVELTHSDPDRRPNGRIVLDRLAACASNSARMGRSSERLSADAHQVFVGRDAQLNRLRELCGQARRGQIVAACISGRSGMGKTALAWRFLEEQQREEPAPLILMARCHERESIAYKAFDGIVDGLSFALSQLPKEQLHGLRIAELHAVGRLFPVLRQLPEISDASDLANGSSEALEQRRQAFDALRELLSRLAQTVPVILFIDDLQWGDLDSAALLRHLVRPPTPPPIAWIVACREEELTAPVTARLLDALSAVPGEICHLAIGALDTSDIRELACRELGSDNPAIDAVVREAAGVPIFAQELLLEARRAPSSLTGESALLGLEAVMTARLSRLNQAERSLLDVVALAAKPLLRQTARLVAGLDTTRAYDAEHGLIAKKLLRLGEGGQILETYHDSIRELATRVLPSERVPALHGALADALLSRGDGDPEDIAHHLKCAGALERAADFAERAARRAASSLAFGRAASLYRMALELRPENHPDLGLVTIELAQALSNAGRGLDAAAAYERASVLLPEQSLSLTCKAAEQLLQSGDVQRGRALVSGLLATFGWHVPESSWRILASIGMRRLQLAVRGLGQKPRTESELSKETIVRLDASWALVSGLSLVNTVYAAYFQNHHLIYALSAGEPRRLLRALAAEAAHASMAANGAARQRGFVVLDTLRRLAAANPSEPIAEPMVAIGTALWSWMFGDWATCQVHAAHAAHLFRTQCTGVTWELGTARTFMLGPLIIMGRYNEYQRLWPELLEDARARGDMFAETKLVLIDLSHGMALANDEPEHAEREALRVLSRWQSEGFDLQEYWALYAQVEIAIYQGKAEKAWLLLEAQRANIARALLLKMKNLRIFIHSLRARAALALACECESRRDMALREVDAEVSTLLREKSQWGTALATLVRGLRCNIVDEQRQARVLLAEAAASLDQVNMAAFAVAARMAYAELIDGEEGKSLRADAERQMVLLGVRNAPRLSRMLAPRIGSKCPPSVR